jgi:hypothetical protein
MTLDPEPHGVAALRGAEAQPIGRPFWVVAGALLIAVMPLVVAIAFVSAANDNARIERLKNHGLPVMVTVTGCVGNIGGSGSNAAGYTCRGEYRVNGVTYREVIGSKTTLTSAGSEVKGVADPARPSTVEVASAVATSSTSFSVYFVPSLLALLVVSLAVFLSRRRSHGRVDVGIS